MLDHMLASEALKSRLAGIDVHNEHLEDEVSAPPGRPGSFHAPLVATFDV